MALEPTESRTLARKEKSVAIASCSSCGCPASAQITARQDSSSDHDKRNPGPGLIPAPPRKPRLQGDEPGDPMSFRKRGQTATKGGPKRTGTDWRSEAPTGIKSVCTHCCAAWAATRDSLLPAFPNISKASSKQGQVRTWLGARIRSVTSYLQTTCMSCLVGCLEGRVEQCRAAHDLPCLAQHKRQPFRHRRATAAESCCTHGSCSILRRGCHKP